MAPGATFPVRPLELPPDRQVQKGAGHPHPGPERRPYRPLRPPYPCQARPSPIWPLTPPSGPRPLQGLRERGNLALAIREPDLRYKVREKRIGRHILFVVDASGSMGADERMAETKAAILSLLIDAYQKRERVGLIVFRGARPRWPCPLPTASRWPSAT